MENPRPVSWLLNDVNVISRRWHGPGNNRVLPGPGGCMVVTLLGYDGFTKAVVVIYAVVVAAATVVFPPPAPVVAAVVAVVVNTAAVVEMLRLPPEMLYHVHWTSVLG